MRPELRHTAAERIRLCARRLRAQRARHAGVARGDDSDLLIHGRGGQKQTARRKTRSYRIASHA